MNLRTLTKVSIGHLLFFLILILAGWLPSLFSPKILNDKADKIKFVRFTPATLPTPTEPLVDLPPPPAIEAAYIPPPPPPPKPPPPAIEPPPPEPVPEPPKPELEPPPKIEKTEPKPEPPKPEPKPREPDPEPEEIIVIPPRPPIEELPEYRPPDYSKPPPPPVVEPPRPEVIAPPRPPAPPPPPQFVTSTSVDQMRAQLESHLGPIWGQVRPNRIRERLTTIISVKVDRSGRTTVLGITRSSGNAAMDQAVHRCLQALRAPIAFPPGENGLAAKINLEFTLN